MRIEVTAEDISQGVPRVSCCCPVARALQRATGYSWRVGATTAAVYCAAGRVLLPEYVRNWIHRYDHEGKGEPFAFELEMPNAGGTG